MSVCVAVAFGFMGSLPTFIQERYHTVWLVTTGFGIGGAFALILRVESPSTDAGIRTSFLMLVALLLAVGSDFLLISADRKLLRWSLSVPRMPGLLAIVLVMFKTGPTCVRSERLARLVTR